MFEVRYTDLLARIGRIKTRSGTIETPYLFPVVDPTMKKQIVSLDEIRSVGFNAVITNAYLLWKGLGTEDDVHKVLNFDGVIMTDSGAYQLMQYGDIDVGNREIVEYQCRIRSDIGVILDIPTKFEDSRERVEYSVHETLRRAWEALDIVERCTTTLWVLPIQGGHHLDLLYESARRSVELPSYSIYALGSPTTLLERFYFDKIVEMIGVVRSVIPLSKPLHLFGAGHPMFIPFAVAMGVDLMDSASYIIYARDGRYMTYRGTYRLEDLDYFPCSCPVCSKYTPHELRETDFITRTKLLALHNLYVLMEELKRVKQAIREGRLWEYLEERARSHPALARAFRILKKFYEKLYRASPRLRPDVWATYILSFDSIYNPKIMEVRRSSLDRAFHASKPRLLLLPLLPWDKPLLESSVYKRVEERLDLSNYDVYGYAPVLGIFNAYASYRYPLSQFESIHDFDERYVDDLLNLATELVYRYINELSSLEEIAIVACTDVYWSSTFTKKFVDLIRNVFGIENVKLIEITCT